MIKLLVNGFPLILILAISGCSSSPYYGEMSTADRYTTPNNLVSYAYNIGKHSAYSVPREGREKHESCVYFALDSLNTGEHCEWATRTALGNVQVISHYPAGSGYCTTLLNSVMYKGKSKAWRDTACVSGTGNNWQFIGS